ncbi:MAG: hypothetical protein WDO18_10250 [Acidobacteriota bacterium]
MKHFAQAAIVLSLGLEALSGQTLNPKIDLPPDSPVGLLSADFTNSSATPRGGMYVVDVRAALSLRNTTQRRIRGITLAVYAPGGKGSFSIPSLDVGPGEAFPIQIENHLLRPLSEAQGGPTVEVKLDGVLFDDLGFYGPDTLGTQRLLKQWELEARRDRKYFKSVLETAGAEGLRKEILLSLAHQNDSRGPSVQIVRGRSTNIEAEREVQFAFTAIPDSPVEAVGGTARVSQNEARAPRFSLRNRSNRAVEHVDIGWIVKDQQGREFFAATLPADLKLAPNQTGEVRQESALRFQKPVAIQSVTGFVSGVEFAGGGQWIPPRGNNALHGLAPASPEESRLLNIYKKNGLDALIGELKKFD